MPYRIIVFFAFLIVYLNNAKAQCIVNADFNTWQQKGDPASGTWNVNAGGTEVQQTTNGQSTYFVTPFDLINVEITGEFRTTNSDDDWMGFVFGFRDPMGNNYNDFDMLLLDWKQQVQGCNPSGMSLVRVLGNIPANQIGNSFGCHIATPEFNILADDFGGPGWVRHQWHQFRLVYTFTRIVIYVDNVLKFDVTGCFLPGRFGFYNRSQRFCDYRNFNYTLDIDFDISATTYCPNSTIQYDFLPSCVSNANYNFTTIQSMNWDFGDGNQFINNNVNASNVNPTHQYTTAGTYQATLTLTDVLGCSSVTTKQVIINPDPVADFEIPDGCINNPVLVNNTSASSVAITDATWDIGNGATINGLNPNGFMYSSANNYDVTLTVTDANGCTASITKNTEIITKIDAALAAADANCPNINDGTASVVTIDNGTSPYTYLWSNNEATQAIQNLIPANYTVTITDVNGCTGEHNTTVAINNNTPLQYSFDVSDYNGFNVSCNGFSDANATINMLSGNAPYNYLWSNSTGGNSIQNIPSGNYTVTISDANTCTVEVGISINEPLPVAVIASIGSNYNGVAITCFNAADGIANATAQGGAGAFSYLWNNAETTQNINSLAAGTYNVTATDINGCTTSATVSITQPRPVEIQLQANEYNGNYNISCNGFADGSINSVISGGTPSYNYFWNTSENTSSISALSSGIYALTVIDINGCEAIESIALVQPEPLMLTLQAEDLLCFGYNDGYITTNVTGGTISYNFNWSNGAIGSTNNNLAAGNYAVTVSDANNCSIAETITLNEPNPVTVTIQPVSDTIPFFGANLQLISSYDANGNEALIFEWTPDNNLDNANIQNPIANPLYTTTYTLKVTDTDGCTGTDSIKVFVNNDKVLYIPNAFSPSQKDGTNDEFKIYTYNNAIRKLTFQIHNRWGELVFQTDDINKVWDGTKNGNLLTPGVYVYTVYIIYLDGDSYKKQGSVTLL